MWCKSLIKAFWRSRKPILYVFRDKRLPCICVRAIMQLMKIDSNHKRQIANVKAKPKAETDLFRFSGSSFQRIASFFFHFVVDHKSNDCLIYLKHRSFFEVTHVASNKNTVLFSISLFSVMLIWHQFRQRNCSCVLDRSKYMHNQVNLNLHIFNDSV